MSQVLPVAWYRFRATLGRRWTGYVSVVLLIGLVGGIALASIAGARRTQSSYPTFFDSTNPSTLTISTFAANSGGNPTGSARLTARIKHLPDVRTARTLLAPEILPMAKDGAPRLGAFGNSIPGGSVDGLLFDQDRVSVVQGRQANPNRADEVEMTANLVHSLGIHIGQVIPLGFYTDAQTNESDFGTTRVVPRLRVDARLVGIVVLNDEVVQDDIDKSYGFEVVTPALMRHVIAVSPEAAQPVLYGLQLEDGDRDIVNVEKSLTAILPAGSTYEFHVTSRVVSAVELSVKPESVALGAFGAIAALVTMVLGIQAISRQLRLGQENRQVLRALGASPAVTAGDGLLGVLIAVVLGSLLAGAVAVGLSPLTPLGPVRPVYPDRGIAFDWTVLGIGLVALLLGLGSAAIALAVRGAPHRARRTELVATQGSRVVRGAEVAGLSTAGVLGLQFALDRGRGRTAVPVRSALVGTVLAVALVVVTLTFASGLNTLVSHPSLYGWDWNYMLNPSDDVPPQTLAVLDHDPDVAAWAGVNLANAQIDGQSFPILLSRTNAELSPPILSGHRLEAKNQIVLGAATMRRAP